jgi:hypothetical protein
MEAPAFFNSQSVTGLGALVFSADGSATAAAGAAGGVSVCCDEFGLWGAFCGAVDGAGSEAGVGVGCACAAAMEYAPRVIAVSSRAWAQISSVR